MDNRNVWLCRVNAIKSIFWASFVSNYLFSIKIVFDHAFLHTASSSRLFFAFIHFVVVAAAFYWFYSRLIFLRSFSLVAFFSSAFTSCHTHRIVLCHLNNFMLLITDAVSDTIARQQCAPLCAHNHNINTHTLRIQKKNTKKAATKPNCLCRCHFFRLACVVFAIPFYLSAAVCFFFKYFMHPFKL